MNEISPRIGFAEKIDETLATRFGRIAASAPDRIAVCAGDEVFTYDELDRLSNRIACALRPLTPDPERPIALMMREGPLLIATMFAAAKTNRIFIPLETRMPEDWLAGIVADSDTACVLHDAISREIAERASRAEVPVFDVSVLAERAAAVSIEAQNISPDAPAFVIYTSGTTGKPKGVLISHRAAMYAPDIRAGILQVGTEDRIANIRSSGTLSGMSNNFLPLLHGGCLFQFDLHGEGLHRLGSWLNENAITGITFSGSLLRTWLAGLPEDFRLSSLRFVVASAEPLYAVDVENLARRFVRDWRVAHTFASSETALIAAYVIGPSDAPQSGIVPIGQPVDGTEVRLETEDGTIAGPGEIGEIVVSSRYLSLGYWKDPKATEKAFSVDSDGMRIHRSGDIGRWRSDGQLEHLGRKDRKIKLRGHSVEPVQVEHGLLRLAGVRDAIVMVEETASNEMRLVGYVASNRDKSAASCQSMRTELGKLLPPHLVPSEIVILDSFPLTARGKLDRAALPKPDERQDERAETYRAPSGGIETTLAAIWEEVLKISKVGADDDFYAIGGTSLQAFLIFARIATRLGCDLPPTHMLEASTVARQADLVRRDFRAVAAEKLVPFRKQGRKAPLFIVHGAFGDIMFVREIVRDLKSDRPVYGVQPPPLDGTHRVPRTVEHIAADYLAEIRKVQPHGPYLLAGYSFGGSVALEMAQTLTRAGERVTFLGLIDSSYDSRKDVAGEEATARVSRHIQSMRSRNLLPYLAQRLRKTIRHHAVSMREAIRQLPCELRYVLRRPIPYEERAPFYRHIYYKATHRYVRHPYAGPVAMFARKDHSEWQRRRWARIAKGGMIVHEIPAGHTEMVWPPYSTKLAACFDECLDGIADGASEHADHA